MKIKKVIQYKTKEDVVEYAYILDYEMIDYIMTRITNVLKNIKRNQKLIRSHCLNSLLNKKEKEDLISTLNGGISLQKSAILGFERDIDFIKAKKLAGKESIMIPERYSIYHFDYSTYCEKFKL